MYTATEEQKALRDLPPKGGERIKLLIKRAFTKRCPQCGGKDIFKHYIELKQNCPTCGYRFEREEGYFLGGYALGVVFTGLIPLILLVFAFIYTDYDWITLELIFIPMAILLPLILFPYTRTLWMMIDLWIHPTEHTEQYLRRGRLSDQ